MAAIRSLGLHQPAALQYLIDEGILSAEPKAEEYTWDTYDDAGTEELGEEEVVTTKNCVVYSTGGIVQKVFNFEIEEQRVQQAVLTWFPAESDEFTRPTKKRRVSTEDASATSNERTVSGKVPLSVSLTVRQKPGYGVQPSRTPRGRTANPTSQADHESRARALVVFLKHLAHVYFLSGASHVVNLPFEIEKAFPAPKGVVLQRKPAESSLILATPLLPSAPTNSFLSPEAKARRRATGQSPKIIRRSPLQKRGTGRVSDALEDLLGTASEPSEDELPRHFVLSDPLSDVGLVVAPPTPEAPTYASSLSQAEALSADEEILHISSSHELETAASPKLEPLIFVVTSSQSQRMYYIYTATYVQTMSMTEAMRKRSRSRSGSRTRRRSSFVPGTGATTPAVRLRDQPRESLSGQVPPVTSQDSNTKQTAEETFASQVDPEYQSFGQPKRESRRVSSLLSRVDLATNQDRSAFQDLASGHHQTATGPGRRGPSIGASGLRTSFGGHRSFARASTPGSTFSRTSFGGSDDDTVADFKESGRFSMTIEDEDDAGGGLFTKPFQDAYDGLKKELVLRKVAEVPIDKPGSFSTWTKSGQLHNPRIFTLVAPATLNSLAENVHHVYLHIVQSYIRDHVEILFRVQAISNTAGDKVVAPTVVRTRRLDDHADAIKIRDGSSNRVLNLHTEVGVDPYLSISTCWAPDLPATTIRLPPLQVFNLDIAWNSSSPDHRTIGRRRTLEIPQDLHKLCHAGLGGTFNIVERSGQQHRLQVQLLPQAHYAATIVELCRLVLPDGLGDLFLSSWWEVMKSLDKADSEREWQALLTVILSLAVGHVAPPKLQKKKPRTPGRSQRRSSASVSAAFATRSEAMQALEQRLRIFPSRRILNMAVWSQANSVGEGLSSKSSESRTGSDETVVACVTRARLFLASEIGSALLSPLYDRGTDGRHDVPRLLVALHLLREEQKLNILNARSVGGGPSDLGPTLAQLGQWLGWEGWNYRKGGCYDLEGCGNSSHAFEDSQYPHYASTMQAYKTGTIQGYPAASPPPTQAPPLLFEWIESASSPATYEPFPALSVVFAQYRTSGGGKVHKALRKLCASFVPRTVMLVQFLEKLNATDWPSAGCVELMAQCGITKNILDTLPESVLLPMKDALIKCQANPPTTWNDSLLELVDRDDLKLLNDVDEEVLKHIPSSTSQPHPVRDVHAICHAADQAEQISFTSELERHRLAQLIFHEDRRYWEAEKLLNTLRPSLAECIPEPSWTEAEILEAQKGIVNLVMVRTFSLAAGQSMFHYDSRRPLVTEKFHIHGYNMSCVMRPMNITVSAERVQFTEEKYGWAWFHAGVSAGLSVSRHADGIDTSWIVFNKPADLSNRHAGLLLGLGLNGHLRSIAKWLSFKYLTPKHTMTSIGLLLGLSASFLGSMDALVTRLLSVHITRMLPQGAAELNLSPLTQTTGLMGIGLLYYGTQHRRMSEIMLSELEYAEIQDPADPPDTLRDESYRLAAAFALGFINLGKGKDLRGLHDMRVVERLLVVAAGIRPVNLIHILDQAVAGTVVATALIFMKTNDKTVARKIDVPDTLPQFDYVRPDILLLRTLAKHMIMWDEIKATDRWVCNNLPSEFSSPAMLSRLKSLDTQHLPFYNILAGLLWAISLRYAGSGSTEIRDFLVVYLDQFIRMAGLPAHRYDAKLTRNTVRNCQDLVALACATVMAGTGDLEVFRRLRKLHGRVNADVTYGSHMATHMALGVLFLGGGSYTLSTSNLAIASLILAFYPLYPSDVTDNRSHLQAFRHFWVLAAEARCLVVRDIDSKRALTMPITITTIPAQHGDAEPTTRTAQAPCLVPPLSQVSKVTTTGPDYWPVTLDFIHNPTHLSAFRTTQTIFVRRKPASAAAHGGSVFSSALVALNDERTTSHARLMWHWLTRLPALADIEQSLWSSVLPPSSATAAGGGDAAATFLHGARLADASPDLIDDRLALLSVAKRGVAADELRNLKAAFAWADNVMRQGDGRLAWLGRRFVSQLKAIIDARGRKIAEAEA